MTLDEYQQLARRTAGEKYLGPGELTLANCALGIAGEAGEVADLVKKFLAQGHTYKEAALEEEVGDVLWYCAIIMDRAGISLEQCAQANLDKLRRRYPEKFTVKESVEREA